MALTFERSKYSYSGWKLLDSLKAQASSHHVTKKKDKTFRKHVQVEERTKQADRKCISQTEMHQPSRRVSLDCLDGDEFEAQWSSENKIRRHRKKDRKDIF